MKLGAHVSNNGSEMLAGSIREAVSYQANCLMVYIGAPQNTIRKQLSQFNIPLMNQLCQEYHINKEDIIVHAPYIINLAQPDQEKRQFAIDFLIREISYVDAIGAKYLVVHPGAHVGGGYEQGINLIADSINQIIERTPKSKVVITIETMASKGTECGGRFEHIAMMIDAINQKDRIGVCFDTCHVNDSGYNLIDNYQEIISQFDQIIGLKYLKVIHLNDSKNITGSKKDRHENIGFGNLGFETILKVVNDPRFKDIPKILETPYVDDPDHAKLSYPPYRFEIAMIKNQQFDPLLKTKIVDYYQNNKK